MGQDSGPAHEAPWSPAAPYKGFRQSSVHARSGCVLYRHMDALTLVYFALKKASGRGVAVSLGLGCRLIVHEARQPKPVDVALDWPRHVDGPC